MERYLDLDLLAIALGGTQNLPTSQDFSKLIAETEVNLLVSQAEVSNQVIEVAWYLFTIASIKNALELYGVERQRAAFQVAGHVFDLALLSNKVEGHAKMRLVFASQVAYLKSQHQPNAIAIRKKHMRDQERFSLQPENYKALSLNSGVALLAFDIGYVYDVTAGLEDQAAVFSRSWGVNSLYDTPFGAAYGLAVGCRNLINFLVYGRDSSFHKAKDCFHKAANCNSAYEDSDCIWMATLLYGLADELYNSSVWKVLPEDVPYNIKRAFTLGIPRVLSLWPPQIDYLSGHRPFDENARFQFLSTPTSGGKTLLAQVLIAHHLSTRFTSACYIAPTRSLCREVAASMKDRLKFLNLKSRFREVLEDSGLDEDDITEPTVDILTPESLAGLLRRDPAAVYAKYGLFVFDEVHAVGDVGRGWVLEQTIALLKAVSDEQNTRIAMISAVIGNRNHFISWLAEGQNEVLEAHSTWRGPRRINAIWNTYPKWRVLREEPMRVSARSKYNRRTYHELFGQLTVRTSLAGGTLAAQTTAPIGELAMKYKINAPTERDRDSSNSLSHNEALIPLIELLAPRGPILCIEATKRDTVALAKTIADKQPTTESEEVRELAEFIEAKLSDAHPLSRVVKKGVAYHHGSLPSDIRTEIEKAMSDGIIKILVATTTMTEGVNLPVQAVIISKVGTYQDNQEFLKIIKGSKMANAIGRAGRATQETEGCVVLVHQGNVSAETFKALDPDDQEKWVTSNLATQEFLNEIAEYEALKLSSADAVFDCKAPVLSGFFSFAWFYLYTISPDGEPDQGKIEKFLQNTMAWLQATPESKASLLSVTNDLKGAYSSAPRENRKLLAQSGSKLGTTRTLRLVFDSIKDELTDDKSAIDLIKIVLSDTTLPMILTVAEAPTKPIYNMRNGNRREIQTPLIEMLEDWINGLSYPSLANKYLADVSDTDYRFEQLGDYISGYFDNFLPWVVGTMIGWINNSTDTEDVLPDFLPGLIRGGVPTRTALMALHQGIYSRQLAVSIAVWKEQNCPDESIFRIRDELRKNALTTLIEALAPSPSELRNLIDFLAEDKAQLLSHLNEHGVCTIDLWNSDLTSPGACQINGPGLRNNFQLYRNDIHVGSIPTKYHVEITTLRKSGLPFEAEITENSELMLSVKGFEQAS